MNAGRVIIASLRGGGSIDPVRQQDYRLYFQNQPDQAGEDPNYEHALIRDNGEGDSVFALRDDLGSAATSLPYALLKHRDPEADLRWKYTVYRVVAEAAPYFFSYPGVAGTLIQPPFPLSLFQVSPQTAGVSGPYWRDRKQSFWARAGGNDGGAAEVVMRFFYPVQPGFHFPGSESPRRGDARSVARPSAGRDSGAPNIRYVVNWPEAPELRIGETLVKSKFGLPDASLQTSVEVIYQQSEALAQQPSVVLIDPTREYQVDLAELPADLITESSLRFPRFPDSPAAPAHTVVLRSDQPEVEIPGDFIEPPAGEYYLLLNVMTARDRATVLALSPNAAFRSAVNTLGRWHRSTRRPSRPPRRDLIHWRLPRVSGGAWVT